MRSTQEFKKILVQLTVCPTCGERLISDVKAGLVLRCSDLFHGRFNITPTGEGYSVNYIPTQRPAA